MRIFKKTKKANGRRHIYLFGIKIFSYKRRKHSQTSAEETILWLKKNNYDLLFNHISETKTSSEYQNCIWQLWLQGLGNCPEIVKICMDSVKKYANGRHIIILTKDNINDYINLPDFIWDKYNKGMISHAHFSDIIRVYLLAKYGGTWIDATVLLTAPIPKVIDDSDFFVFKDVGWWQTDETAPSFTSNKISKHLLQKFASFFPDTRQFPNISNWFIHSKPNTYAINSIKSFLMTYWEKENKSINYFIFHLFLIFADKYDVRFHDIFMSMPQISNRDVHLLQSIMFDKFDQKIFDEIKSFSPIHKLTYKGVEKDVLPNSFLKHILKG